MRPEADRILTTHAGSLPRPADLLPLLVAKETGGGASENDLRNAARAAVLQTVRQQAAAGVDVVGDGEMSKPSYASYPKDRLTGFGGELTVEEFMGTYGAIARGHDDFAPKMMAAMGSWGDGFRLTACDGTPRRSPAGWSATPRSSAGRT
jgi:hypothetical protein